MPIASGGPLSRWSSAWTSRRSQGWWGNARPPLDRMIAYAARTGTRRNLDVLRAAGWRLMVSAKGALRTEGFRYALDNGAWTAHSRGEPFDEIAFVRAFERLGDGADFVIAPDVVAGGLDSLRLSEKWIPRLERARLVLVPVQDGVSTRDVAPLLYPRVGIFVGGTTEWKLSTTRAWGELARERGAYLHVGRVNTARRVRLCQEAGAHSFDGSSVTRYASTLPLLDAAVRQMHLRERAG